MSRSFSSVTIRYCHVRGVGSGRAVGPADGYPGCAVPKLFAVPPGIPRSLGSWPGRAAGDRRLPGRPFRRRRGMVIDPWPSELAVYQRGAGICGAGASDDVPGCVALRRAGAWPWGVFRPGPWRSAGPGTVEHGRPRRHGRTACEGGVSRRVLPVWHQDRRRWLFGALEGEPVNKFDVRVYAIRRRPARRRPFEVRWQAAGRARSKSFITRALADSYRAELIRAARRGLEFDPATGEPVLWAGPEPVTVTWYQHAAAYATMKWPGLAARSRASLADALATVTPALTRTAAELAASGSAAHLVPARLQPRPPRRRRRDRPGPVLGAAGGPATCGTPPCPCG